MTKKGYTVVEIIVVVGLVSLISLVLVEIFVSHNRLYRTSFSQAEVQNNNFLAMFQISEVINEATEILASQIINGVTYITDQDTVVLKLPAFDNNGDPVVGFDYAAVHIDPQDTKKLFLEIAALANSRRKTGQKLLTNSLAEISFKYNNASPILASAVTVFLSVSQTVNAATNVATASNTVYLQNK